MTFYATVVFQIYECLFLVPFLSFWLLSLVSFRKLVFQKLVTIQLLECKFCLGQQNTFHPHKNSQKLSLYKKLPNYILGWSVWNRKVTNSIELAQNWNTLSKFDKKNYFFNNTTHSRFTWLCKPGCKYRHSFRCTLRFQKFAKKQRYEVLVNRWRFMWSDLQFKNIFWYCYCWKAS